DLEPGIVDHGSRAGRALVDHQEMVGRHGSVLPPHTRVMNGARWPPTLPRVIRIGRGPGLLVSTFPRDACGSDFPSWANAEVGIMNEMTLLILAGLGTIVVLIVIGMPVWLSFHHERLKQEREHLERIKALEVGRALPGEARDEPWSMPARLAFSIGAGVPI